MFLILGFKSVTMDDIATEMGISKKTIYQHFSNKTDLVKEVTLYLFENISCGIDAICNVGKNPIEELFEIKNFVLQHLKDESSSPFYQLHKYYPKIHAVLKKKQFEKMSGCVTDNISRGINLGLFRKEIDLHFVARIYFAGMTAIKDTELFPTENYKPRELQTKYLEYHLRGICTLAGIEHLENKIKTNEI